MVDLAPRLEADEAPEGPAAEHERLLAVVRDQFMHARDHDPMVAGTVLGDRLAAEKRDRGTDARNAGLGELVIEAGEAIGLGVGGAAYVVGVRDAQDVHSEPSTAAHARPRERVV